MSVGILDNIKTIGQSKKRTGRLQSIVIHTVLLIGAALVFFPVFWMISTSLKPPHLVTKFPPVWFPIPIKLENYYQALTMYKPVPFYVFVKNSFILSLGNVVGTVISNTIVAFAFARLRFRGSRILFLIVLSTMMLPPQITMIPLFVLFSKLGWVNTFKPLIVPQFFCNAFYIFLMRQFFTTIPSELDDAARIDGCGVLGLFFRIMLPLSRPAIGIMAIFEFTWQWNNFLEPLIYLNKMEMFPLAIAISFMRSQIQILWAELMVVSLIAMLPPVLLFFIAQKAYIQGIVVTGVR